MSDPTSSALLARIQELEQGYREIQSNFKKWDQPNRDWADYTEREIILIKRAWASANKIAESMFKVVKH